MAAFSEAAGTDTKGQAIRMSASDRDVLIRTIIGEAAAEKPIGQAAVAHVIFNRAASNRYPNNITAVAKQGNGKYHQFSTWNSLSREGNRLPYKYNPGDPTYERVGAIVDRAANGDIPDPTGGATHYYSPAGMRSGRAPRWWNDEVAKAGGVIRIGNHRFAGNPRKANTASVEVVAEAKRNPNTLDNPYRIHPGGDPRTVTGSVDEDKSMFGDNFAPREELAESYQGGAVGSTADGGAGLPASVIRQQTATGEDDLFAMIRAARSRRQQRLNFLEQGFS